MSKYSAPTGKNARAMRTCVQKWSHESCGRLIIVTFTRLVATRKGAGKGERDRGGSVKAKRHDDAKDQEHGSEGGGGRGEDE